MPRKPRAPKKLVRKIGILTGGGDAPGLNAVIRAAVRSALLRGWEVYGIEQGFEGLLLRGKVRRLVWSDIRGIIHIGGTMLGTSNRGNPFEFVVKRGRRKVVEDRSDDVVRRFRDLGLDGLIVIGGDGSLRIADRLAAKGIPLVGVPKTIDNDLAATVVTFGFDTAVQTATDAIDRLHSTAASHNRTMVVEVMGRYAGWIALNAGVAAGAEVILIPEIPFDIDVVCGAVQARYKKEKGFSIVVAAEGAAPRDGDMFVAKDQGPGREVKLGGIAEWVADEITSRTGVETRSLALGHLLRGGRPSAWDRLLATRFGAAAVRCLAEGHYGCMVCLRPPKVETVGLRRAVERMKGVPPDCDTMVSARNIGICFGDEAVVRPS